MLKIKFNIRELADVLILANERLLLEIDSPPEVISRCFPAVKVKTPTGPLDVINLVGL